MKNKLIPFILLGLIAIGSLIFFMQKGNNSTSTQVSQEILEPKFKQDASLTLWKGVSRDSIATIAIELADTESKMERGLMFRRSMPEKAGMLFVYQDEDIRSFWMKDTYIPLDILYINSQFRIVTIHEQTEPFSEASLPSTGPAQYVLELNGGFCKKYGLELGDLITYQKLP